MCYCLLLSRANVTTQSLELQLLYLVGCVIYY